MDDSYQVQGTAGVPSPALFFFKDLIRENIARMVALAGRPERLRPHAKTHKTQEIARLELAAGVTKQKCATVAEAEALAQAGVPDVLLAYPAVGPNTHRLARLMHKYPVTRFSALADHPAGVEQLGQAMTAAGLTGDVLLDLDVGQHRTGIAPGERALALYERVARTPGLSPGGLHVYDGHNHQEDRAERRAAVDRLVGQVFEFRDALQKAGFPVPRLVFGGTPTFGIYAELDRPGVECSPGTCVLHDWNYARKYPELGFTPAALLLTRVVSRPRPDRVTFDLGYKAVSSDPPLGGRCFLPALPTAQVVLQNEEHLVVQTPEAERFRPGDEAWAVPAHVCPTVALHQFAHVVEGGRVVDRWAIVARDRVITV